MEIALLKLYPPLHLRELDGGDHQEIAIADGRHKLGT